MKVMYIAPRFHPNQADIVKGWIKSGNQVTFVSCYTAPIEDYSYVKPIVLGYSPLYYPIDFLYMNVFHKNDPENTAFKINHGFPPLLKICRILKKEKPDIVILRDRTLYTIASYYFCKKLHIKSILYTQSPLYGGDAPKKDFLHRLVRGNTPKYRITPVLGNDKNIKDKNAFYVPFVMEPKFSPKEKKYFIDDCIEILDVGVFEPRKNHLLILNQIDLIRNEYKEKIHLTIIGEVTTDLQSKHLNEVKKFIEEKKLDDLVTVITNIPHKDMGYMYKKADFFVIPSTRENASISQVEAMSYSLPIICSETNGSSCYIENGINGYLFKDNDGNDLKNAMMKMISNKNRIIQMGTMSYKLIKEKYQFSSYKESIDKIISKIESER